MSGSSLLLLEVKMIMLKFFPDFFFFFNLKFLLLAL